jgi:hypothetical protein
MVSAPTSFLPRDAGEDEEGVNDLSAKGRQPQIVWLKRFARILSPPGLLLAQGPLGLAAKSGGLKSRQAMAGQ